MRLSEAGCSGLKCTATPISISIRQPATTFTQHLQKAPYLHAQLFNSFNVFIRNTLTAFEARFALWSRLYFCVACTSLHRCCQTGTSSCHRWWFWCCCNCCCCCSFWCCWCCCSHQFVDGLPHCLYCGHCFCRVANVASSDMYIYLEMCSKRASAPLNLLLEPTMATAPAFSVESTCMPVVMRRAAVLYFIQTAIHTSLSRLSWAVDPFGPLDPWTLGILDF